MIKIQGKIPTQVAVACSGGPDSMAVLDFLRRHRKLQVIFMHHGTQASDEGQEVVTDYCRKYNITFHMGEIRGSLKRPCESLEEFWRNERYDLFQFLSSFSKSTEIIVTAHHLDDCVEEYLINTLVRGFMGTIPYRHGTVIRPFRLTTKNAFLDWCFEHDVPFVTDSSNSDLAFLRPRIRLLRKEIEKNTNPGIAKIVKKMLLEQQDGIIQDNSNQTNWKWD